MNINTPSSALIDTLQEHHVDYELLPHQRTLSAADEARVVGVDPGHVAKTLVLATGTGFVRAVLSASERIDLHKVRAVLGSGDVQLASEEALAGAYPQFELGAVPPVGGPDHDVVLMDERLRTRSRSCSRPARTSSPCASRPPTSFRSPGHASPTSARTEDEINGGPSRAGRARRGGRSPRLSGCATKSGGGGNRTRVRGRTGESIYKRSPGFRFARRSVPRRHTRRASHPRVSRRGRLALRWRRARCWRRIPHLGPSGERRRQS